MVAYESLAAGVWADSVSYTHLVALGQAAGRLDADLLLLAGAFVLGRNIDDAVGVDVESDLDLRHAARRRRNTDEIE